MSVVALLVFGAPLASATTGSIEGAVIDPSMDHALVQNLSVVYDGCSTSGKPDCAWDASAWLVAAAPASGCPIEGAWLAMFLANPPGEPGLMNRRVWRKDATGDGTVQSGSLDLDLDLGGGGDQFLCLYATDQTAPYPGVPDSSNLLASMLLRVDQSSVDQPSTAPPSGMHQVRCKRGFRRIKVHRKTVCRKIRTHHHHH